jgi:hypothetical protein
MNRQPILDAIALIAGGGPTAGDPTGIYRGAGGIVTADGKRVAVAYSSLRAVPDVQNDDFVHVCTVDETVLGGGASDLTTWTHRIRMQLLVSVSRSDMRTATRLLEAFVPAYFNAYTSVGLGGVIASGGIVSVRGPIGVEPLYPERHALEFIYEATEKGSYLRVA